MAWRLANSLEVLRNEIRSKYRDTTVWTIGDQAHQSGYSDHNPTSQGVVCAIDVKADGGMSLQAFVDHLVAHPHPNLRYVIFNRRICQRSNGWKWKAYYGVNAHKDHAHVSVGNGPDGRSTGSYDGTSPWGVASLGQVTAPGFPDPTLRESDTGPEVEALQAHLNRALGLSLATDGDYGPATTTAVRELQRRAGLTADGIYGSASAAALRDLLEDDMDLTDKLPVTKFTTDTWDRRTLDVQTALSHGYVYSRSASDNTARLLKLQEAVLAKVAGADTKSILDAINNRAAEDAQRDAALLAEVQELASGGATAQEVYDLLVSKLTRADE